MKLLRINRKLTLIIGTILLLVFSSIAYLVAHNPKGAEAAWFNDSYTYRQLFSFTHNADITTDRAVTFSLDTAELIAAGLMQSDCDDTRFTDLNGRLLRFELTGSCNNAATTYEVVFPSIVNGTNSAYVYYGNPAAISGSASVSGITALTPSGGDPAITDRAVEEKGTTPILYWNFDEGYGTTANDSTQYSNSGTFKGSGEPVWQNEDMCLFGGKCVKFDNSNDYVRKTYSSDTELDPSTGSFTISAWFKHSSTPAGTDTLISRADGVNGVGYKVYMDSSGFICFGIDAVAGSFTSSGDQPCTTVSYADSKWHLVHGVKSTTTSLTVYIDGKQVAQDSSITSSSISGTNADFYAGLDVDAATNPWDGFIDEVKYYNFAKTQAQINTDFANRGSNDQVAATFGSTDATTSLNQGLVGYWKMDEGAANTCTGGTNDACDLSGNSLDGAWTASATSTGTAKFGNAVVFDGGADYIDIGNQSNLFFSGGFTVSAWIRRTGGSGNRYIVTDYDGSGAQSTFALRVNSSNTIDFYWEQPNLTLPLATSTTTIATNTWYHVVGVWDGTTRQVFVNGTLEGTNATAQSRSDVSGNTAIGRAGSFNGGYFPGQIDDVRVYNRALSPAEVTSLYNWAPGPTVYLKMDEASWTNDCSTSSVFDSSGNALNAQSCPNTTGPTATRIGKFGRAGNFDGTNDYVNVSDPGTSLLDVSGSWSMSAWIRANAFGGVGIYETIATKDSSNNANYGISLLNDEVDCFFYASGYQEHTTNVDLSTNTWYHVACSFDDQNNTMKIYVNGVQVLSETENNSPTANGASITISKSPGGEYFNGQIDELRLYKYYRTPSQILQDMNAGHPTVGTPVGSYAGYWPLDEGYSTTAHDASPLGNDLTLSTASWTNSGKFDKAWNGTGSNPYLSKTDDPDFDFGSSVDFSLSAWVKSDSTSNPGASQFIFDKQVSGNNPGYRLYFNTSGQLVCDIDDDTTSYPEDTATGTTDYYDNAWHHVICIRDITADKLNLYVDGKLHTQDTDLSATGDLSNGDTLTIGAQDTTDSGTDDFAGDLDEIKIYRSALTAQDVQIEYNQGKSQVMGSLSTTSGGIVADNSSDRSYCVPGDTSTCSAPVEEWRFDEDSGATTHDSSSNLSGTLTNGPLWVPGKLGNAIKFDGSNDQIVVDSTSLSTTFDNISQSQSVWVYLTAAPGSFGEIFTGNQVIFEVASDRTFDFYANGSTCTSNDTVALKQWHHLSAVFNNTADTTDLYLDGVLNKHCTGMTNSPVGVNTTYIGSDSADAEVFPGIIDNLLVYTYARTAAQIAWDYNRGMPYDWWQFDECTGSTLNNAMGTGNSGTITIGASGTQTTAGACTTVNSAAAWYNGATGKFNGSLKFDGTDDYVDLGNVDNSLNQTRVTLSAWMKRNAAGSAMFVGKYANADGLYIEYATDGTLNYQVSNTPTETFGSVTLNDTSWHLITMVFDGSQSGNANRLKGYVDGVQQTLTFTGTIPAQTPTVNTTAFTFGRGGEGASDFDTGQLDDVRFYLYNLNALQVKTLYNENASVRFGPSTGSP